MPSSRWFSFAISMWLLYWEVSLERQFGLTDVTSCAVCQGASPPLRLIRSRQSPRSPQVPRALFAKTLLSLSGWISHFLILVQEPLQAVCTGRPPVELQCLETCHCPSERKEGASLLAPAPLRPSITPTLPSSTSSTSDERGRDGPSRHVCLALQDELTDQDIFLRPSPKNRPKSDLVTWLSLISASRFVPSCMWQCSVDNALFLHEVRFGAW